MIVFALELLVIYLSYILYFNKFPKLYKYLIHHNAGDPHGLPRPFRYSKTLIITHDQSTRREYTRSSLNHWPYALRFRYSLWKQRMDVLIDDNSYRVYKSHNETIIFLKKFNKKYK